MNAISPVACTIAAGLLGCTIGEESELDVLDDDIRAELERVPNVQLWAERNGLPLFVTGQFGQQTRTDASLVARFYRLTDAELELESESVDGDAGRTALRFRQVRNGLPIVGAKLKLEVAADGMLDTVSGDVRGGGDLDATPLVTAEAAVAAAIDDPAKQASAPVLVYRATEEGPRLAWQVEVESSILDTEYVYVGAKDGLVIDRSPQTSDALARRIYSAGEVYPSPVPGTLKRVEGGAASGDAQVDANYVNLGKVHACLATAFGRDSYDAKGSMLVSTTHYRYNAAGTTWNASWNNARKAMIYSGDTAKARSAVYDVDVTAHEIGHGITRAESGLEYLNESGAINEGMSDVYGAVCDAAAGDQKDVFQIGEDVFLARPALRFMYNPTQDGSSRDFYPERYTGTDDNGGVHWNSGIVNLAFYLLSQGGKHPRGKSIISVPGIGLAKAARIFHRANTTYLTPRSNFRSLRAATMNAALALYGPSEVGAVLRAWLAVGVK